MATNKKQQRVNFSRMQKHMPYPDFLEIQLKSFADFVQMDSTPEQRRKEGLFKVFSENFPIQDTRNSFTLAFLDYSVDRPRYSIEECIKRGLTYSVQRCRACRSKSVAPFTGRVLRHLDAQQRYQALFGPYHPVPRFVDRVRDRYQQGHVCLHRP